MAVGGSGPGAGGLVYAVHATTVENVGAITAVFDDLNLAREYAERRSSDIGVLCAAVNSFHLNQLGTRSAVTWYLRGVEQVGPYGRSRVGGMQPSLTEAGPQ